MITLKKVRQIVLHRTETPLQMWIKDIPETYLESHRIEDYGWVFERENIRDGNVSLMTTCGGRLCTPDRLKKYEIILPKQRKTMEISFSGSNPTQPTIIKGNFTCNFTKSGSKNIVECQ